MNVMNQNHKKFDNYDVVFFNKLLAYSSIINSLNYKWYKSSKRRFLLPNFYFTRTFYNFCKLIFFKNTFRKKIQPNFKFKFINPLFFFEKKMFLKNVDVVDFLKKNNTFHFFLTKKNIFFLKKDNFFFKKTTTFGYDSSNQGLFVSGDFVLDQETRSKLFIFEKNKTDLKSNDFNLLFYFLVFNTSLIEFYKIIVLLVLKNSINNLKFF